MVDCVVGIVEELVDSDGSRSSESRTLALCNCFTVECGSPWILKSMSYSILSRINSLSMLSVVISRCTSGHLVVRRYVYQVADRS